MPSISVGRPTETCDSPSYSRAPRVNRFVAASRQACAELVVRDRDVAQPFRVGRAFQRAAGQVRARVQRAPGVPALLLEVQYEIFREDVARTADDVAVEKGAAAEERVRREQAAVRMSEESRRRIEHGKVRAHDRMEFLRDEPQESVGMAVDRVPGDLPCLLGHRRARRGEVPSPVDDPVRQSAPVPDADHDDRLEGQVGIQRAGHPAPHGCVRRREGHVGVGDVEDPEGVRQVGHLESRESAQVGHDDGDLEGVADERGGKFEADGSRQSVEILRVDGHDVDEFDAGWWRPILR